MSLAHEKQDWLRLALEPERARHALTARTPQTQAAIERVILDPKYHDVLAVLKGARNGAVYGTKVRFPHALVMICLFRSGT